LKKLSNMEMEVSDEELQLLIEKIALDHNWDLSQYKPKTLKRRILTRMHLAKINSADRYYEYITENKAEYVKLLNALTVNYTYWFRDTSVWSEVLNIMAEKAFNNEEVRIWSAGCSTGQEPYSLAILARKILDKYPDRDLKFRIYASDIDDVALEKAKNGLFSKQFVNIDEQERGEYFDDFDEDNLKIKKEIQDMVEFRKLNLTKDNYYRNLDIILCRNVMIYFSKELQTDILQNFYYSLKKEGFLINGKTEVLPMKVQHLYDVVNLQEHIFKKL